MDEGGEAEKRDDSPSPVGIADGALFVIFEGRPSSGSLLTEDFSFYYYYRYYYYFLGLGRSRLFRTLTVLQKSMDRDP